MGIVMTCDKCAGAGGIFQPHPDPQWAAWVVCDKCHPEASVATGKEVSTEGIDITPEMVEAGASVLCSFQTLTAGEEYWAKQVYATMERVRRGIAPPA